MKRLSIILLLFCLGCATTHVRPGMDAAEALYTQAQDDLEAGFFPEAQKSFADLKSKHPYSKYAVLADLRLADLEFKRGRHLEAVDGYRNFLKYHPDHSEADYAMFRVGEAFFEDIPGDWFLLPPSVEKDQVSTRRAADAYAEMLARFPKSTYAAKASEHQGACRRRLADHEMYVARYYFDHKHYRSAALRAEGVLTDFAGLGLDAEALWISGKSRLALQEEEAGWLSLEKLASHFPTTPRGQAARLLLNGRPGLSKVGGVPTSAQ